MRVSQRAFLAIASLACVLALGALWAVTGLGVSLAVTVTVGALLSLVAIGLAYQYFRVSLHVRTSPDLGDRQPTTQPFTPAIRERVEAFESQIRPRQAARFAAMLTRPSKYF